MARSWRVSIYTRGTRPKLSSVTLIGVASGATAWGTNRDFARFTSSSEQSAQTASLMASSRSVAYVWSSLITIAGKINDSVSLAANVKFLEQYPEFVDFHKGGSKDPEPSGGIEPEGGTEQTPLEAIETAYETIRDGLVSELLEQVMQASPDFFERLDV